MNIRMLGIAILLQALATLAVVPALASAVPAGHQVSSGSIELSPSVSFAHSNLKREGYGNVESSTQFDLTPTVGFCISNHYEVTGGMLVRHTSSNGNSETVLGNTAGLIYNFSPKGNIIPFVGGGFGVLFNGGFTFDDTAVLAPDLAAGVRVLVGNSGSVNLKLGYQHESDGNVKVNRLVSAVGVSLFPW